MATAKDPSKTLAQTQMSVDVDTEPWTLTEQDNNDPSVISQSSVNPPSVDAVQGRRNPGDDSSSSYDSERDKTKSLQLLDDEIQTFWKELPPHLKAPFIDVLVLYSADDRDEAEKFRVHLVDDIKIPSGEKMRALLYDCPEFKSLSGSPFEHLELAFERSTYVFVYLTKSFVECIWCKISSESCLMKAIYDEEKRWSVVPVYTQKKTSCNFKIPMCFNSLKGINYYNNDEFDRNGVAELVGDKITVKDRLAKALKIKQKEWIEKYKREQKEIENEQLKTKFAEEESTHILTAKLEFERKQWQAGNLPDSGLFNMDSATGLDGNVEEDCGSHQPPSSVKSRADSRSAQRGDNNVNVEDPDKHDAIHEQQKKENEMVQADENKQEESRESFEEIRKKSQFDGRIINIGAEWFEKTINEHCEKIPETKLGAVYTSGKYGEVYKYTEKGRSLAIKKMQCENRDDLVRHAHQEISWGRLMHYAINPLLAVGEDRLTQTHYLVFPLPEKGVLTELIAGDLQKINSGNMESLILNQKRRLGMLYQIVTALTYLHKAVPNFRGMVSHGWVCSENVVVDRRFNVRLTNFGKAREDTADTEDLPEAVKQDYIGFGGIILELLTSQPPKHEDGKSLVEQELTVVWGDNDEKYIQAVWGNEKRKKKGCAAAEALMVIAKKYVEGKITKADIWEESQRKYIENLLRSEFDSSDKWNGDRDSTDCDICVINPASQEWAAVLISGGERNKEKEAMFREDMTRVYKKITSQYPLIMGICKDSVYQICPGKDKPPKAQLDEAFQDLQGKIKQSGKGITSLLVYYTGHYYEKKGCFLLDHGKKEFLDLPQLQRKLQDQQKMSLSLKIVIFLDCCRAPKLTGADGTKLPFIQVNSSRSTEKSEAILGEGSLFTSYLLKGLSGKAYKDSCLNERKLELKGGCQICFNFTCSNGFISVEALTKYVDQHIDAYTTEKGPGGTETVLNLKDVNWKDATIAYFIDKQLDFEFCLQHGDKAEYKSVHQLPYTMTALKEELLTAFADSDPIKQPGFGKADADILVISSSTGSGGADNSEDLVHVGQILGAWNLKRKLQVGLRPLTGLVHGKVGVVIEEEGVTVQTLLDVLKLCVNAEWVKQMDSSVHVNVPLMEESLKTLHKALQDKSQMKGAVFLTNKLQSIKNNSEIKKKQQGEVVIAFPNDTANIGGAKKNFITFQIKGAVRAATRPEDSPEDSPPASSQITTIYTQTQNLASFHLEEDAAPTTPQPSLQTDPLPNSQQTKSNLLTDWMKIDNMLINKTIPKTLPLESTANRNNSNSNITRGEVMEDDLKVETVPDLQTQQSLSGDQDLVVDNDSRSLDVSNAATSKPGEAPGIESGPDLALNSLLDSPSLTTSGYSSYGSPATSQRPTPDSPNSRPEGGNGQLGASARLVENSSLGRVDDKEQTEVKQVETREAEEASREESQPTEPPVLTTEEGTKGKTQPSISEIEATTSDPNQLSTQPSTQPSTQSAMQPSMPTVQSSNLTTSTQAESTDQVRGEATSVQTESTVNVRRERTSTRTETPQPSTAAWLFSTVCSLVTKPEVAFSTHY